MNAAAAFLVLLVATPLVDCKPVQKRVIGGERMQKGEMPWLVSVAFHYSDGTMSVCGASLINGHFLLTAAHCYFDNFGKPLRVGGSCPTCRWVARLGTEFMGTALPRSVETESEDGDGVQRKVFEETQIFRELEERIKEHERQDALAKSSTIASHGNDSEYTEYEYEYEEEDKRRNLDDGASLWIGRKKRADYRQPFENALKFDSFLPAKDDVIYVDQYESDSKPKQAATKNQEEEINQVFEAEILQVIPHPLFNLKTLDHDIAVMVLSKAPPEYLSKHLATVKLPTSEMVGKFPTPFEKCLFAGWGCEHSGSGLSSYANKVNLTMRNDELCEAIYENNIDCERQLCAGTIEAEHKGTCPGDSGGPLLCSYNNELYQAGVLSYGVNGKEAFYPPVFSRVTYYLEWIKLVLSKYA